MDVCQGAGCGAEPVEDGAACLVHHPEREARLRKLYSDNAVFGLLLVLASRLLTITFLAGAFVALRSRLTR